jgi:hypothetical protein
MGPKRRQKSAPEVMASPAKSSFSQREKDCGSAKVKGNRSIVEPLQQYRIGFRAVVWAARNSA